MSGKRNIVLIGFMGTGKSTVGRALAERVGWTFVDADSVLEQEAGMPIPEVFRTQGEPAFRDLESRVLARILTGSCQVVSTGGGAVLREENRKAMLDGGTVVALKADADEIIARVKSDTNRPLLAGDTERNVRTLLDARKSAYDFAELILDTGTMKVDEVVDRLADYCRQG